MTSTTTARRGEKPKETRKKTPVECSGPLNQCYKEGFNAGYDLGYVIGARDWEDA